MPKQNPIPKAPTPLPASSRRKSRDSSSQSRNSSHSRSPSRNSRDRRSYSRSPSRNSRDRRSYSRSPSRKSPYRNVSERSETPERSPSPRSPRDLVAPKGYDDPKDIPPAPETDITPSRPSCQLPPGNLEAFKSACEGNGWSAADLTAYLKKIPAPGGLHCSLPPVMDGQLEGGMRGNNNKLVVSKTMATALQSAHLGTLSSLEIIE